MQNLDGIVTEGVLRAAERPTYANSVIGWFTLGVNLREEPGKYESGNLMKITPDKIECLLIY